jgi:fluoroquinolone resistance protein
MIKAEEDIRAEETNRFVPECDIEDETFKGLELIGTNLQRAKIVDCTFEDCMLNAIDLKDTNLQARFINCKIQGINFFTAKRTFLSLNFERCLIRYSSFAELSLVSASFENCTLEHVDFADAKLVSAKFNGSTFNECVFKNTDLSKADFRDSRGYQIDPTLNRMGKARFDLPEAVSLLAPFNIRLD